MGTLVNTQFVCRMCCVCAPLCPSEQFLVIFRLYVCVNVCLCVKDPTEYVWICVFICKGSCNQGFEPGYGRNNVSSLECNFVTLVNKILYSQFNRTYFYHILFASWILHYLHRLPVCSSHSFFLQTLLVHSPIGSSALITNSMI